VSGGLRVKIIKLFSMIIKSIIVKQRFSFQKHVTVVLKTWKMQHDGCCNNMSKCISIS